MTEGWGKKKKAMQHALSLVTFCRVYEYVFMSHLKKVEFMLN